MGTSLDIKIKRANKVYHAGVSGVGGPAGFVTSRTSLTLGVPGRGRGVSPRCVVHADGCPTETPPLPRRPPYRDAPNGVALCSESCGLRVRNRNCSPIRLNIRLRLGQPCRPCGLTPAVLASQDPRRLSPSQNAQLCCAQAGLVQMAPRFPSSTPFPLHPESGEREMLSGVVVIFGKDPIQHQGVSLTAEGTVNLQLSAKSVGVFEAFYNSVKPIQIISSTMEMVKPGKFPSGKTEIPFEFPLQGKGSKVLYETYHGVFVSIQYTLRCDMKRSLLAKDLTKTCEFIVHSAPQKGKLTPSPVDFTITPETLQNVKERALLPKFLIRGHLNSTNCVITQPLTGELVVESSEAAIRSIELQLVRVETCGCAEGYARDATEIQNIQIADGDVCRSLSVPIYMVFPRLFTCPTLETTNFRVEFEVNIVVLLQGDHLIAENFPLKLCRV
ncbi:Down syndrome critical region protein 3 [Pteropus alecto]|uniref:Vacuolar protein sorting-associated protein 26C n=1 Tax=Pteropus alecto TaxID=9402 RepID=L5KCK0_PTEAL|nr:Down syndrome critical region protein 3 [Pteropus alecto]